MDVAIATRHLVELQSRGFDPVVIDVRREAAYADAVDALPGAIRRAPEHVDLWAPDLEFARPVVVYCVRGHEVGQEAAAALRRNGVQAAYLIGGIEPWREEGRSLAPKPTEPSVWVTRERPRIDRLACPWLIRRFVDRDARFLFVPTDRVFAVAEETGATPFDIPGARFGHRGDLCSFDAFLDDYGLADPALRRLAAIVRGADTSSLGLAPESAGLFAISLGLAGCIAEDRVLLRHGLLVYDALHRWLSELQGKTHAWPPAMGVRP